MHRTPHSTEINCVSGSKCLSWSMPISGPRATPGLQATGCLPSPGAPSCPVCHKLALSVATYAIPYLRALMSPVS